MPELLSSEYYGVYVEGANEAWHHTKAATADDWQDAVAVAKQKSAESDGRNWVIRHHSREGGMIIATVAGDDVIFPRQPTPRLQAEEPSHVVTFSKSEPTGPGALDGLRRMPLREAQDVVALAAKIPKHGRIVNAQTGEVVNREAAS